MMHKSKSNIMYINKNRVKYLKNVLICDIMNITYESITQISRLQYMYFMVLQNNIRHDYLQVYEMSLSFVSTYMYVYVRTILDLTFYHCLFNTWNRIRLI